MVFGTIILALVAGIAFYHFVQGFFSALISAVLVFMCAMVAISYHEQVAESVLANVMPNFAHAVALVGLFGVGYLILRLLTDRLIPGNIRVPVLVDKIGAAAFGAVAGVLACGILTLAAELLPIGPDIAGYSRYATSDRDVPGVKVPGKYRLQDLKIYGELTADTLDPGRASGLFPLQVDDMTVGLASYLSDGGSLAGERSLSSVHPSYMDELFAHRLGPAMGSDVSMPKGQSAGITVKDVYSTPSVLNNQQDFESAQIRGVQAPAKISSPDLIPVVVRVGIDSSGSKNNGFNMGSVRLVLKGRNFNPVGSFQKGETMLLTRPDDTLYVEGHGPVDFVFMIDRELLPHDTDGKLVLPVVLPANSFIQMRRSARVGLGDREVAHGPSSDSSTVGIIEKQKAINY